MGGAQDTKFLTVTAENGGRFLINLDQVFEVAEAEGGCCFMFTNGSVLVTRDDFESVALAVGYEAPGTGSTLLKPVPLGEHGTSWRAAACDDDCDLCGPVRAADRQRRAERQERARHPWRTFREVQS